MKIVSIFEVVNGSLLSVQFDDKPVDEFSYFMDYWTDTELLRTFFKNHENKLNGDFYKGISVNQAVLATIEDAERMEKLIMNIAKAGKVDVANSLQTLFKALDDNEYKVTGLQKSKMSGPVKKSWLRLYGIKLGANLFVICGGGIKLTHKINESDHLKKELQKLEITKNYLKKKEILDENDYEFFEF